MIYNTKSVPLLNGESLYAQTMVQVYLDRHCTWTLYVPGDSGARNENPNTPTPLVNVVLAGPVGIVTVIGAPLTAEPVQVSVNLPVAIIGYY